MITHIKSAIMFTNFFIGRAMLEVFIRPRPIKRLLKGKLIKKALKSYTKKAAHTNISAEMSKEPSYIIWQYWEQGLDNAPDIVKACVNSVEKYKNGNKHIVLDKTNVKEYANIPEHIWEKYDKGLIPPANMSDIIRTYLLAKHGGIWVDATVLFTENLPQYIIDADLFLFQNYLKTDLDGLNIASYFIGAKKNNELILRMKEFIELYWKENSRSIHYFMHLHAFTQLTQETPELKEQFAKVPFFGFMSVQHLGKELLNQYDEKRWEQLKKISPIHKLSWKQKVLNRSNTNPDGTYLEKLLKQELF